MKRFSRKLINIFLFWQILSLVLIVSSCSIQKRTLNKGYFIQWNWNKKMLVNPNKTNNNSTYSEDKTSESFKNQDTLETEIAVNTIVPENLINREDKVSIESTISNEKIDDKVEHKNKTNFSAFIFSQDRLYLKTYIDKNEKTKDEGILLHILFTTALAIFLLGVILMIRGMSTNYLNFAFFPGIIFSFAGFILFLFGLILLIKFLIKRSKNKITASEETKKKYQIFTIIDVALIFITLIIILIAMAL